MREQSIAVNTAVAVGGRVLHVAFGVAITAAVTRLLGLSAFGAYATLLAVCSLLATTADFGLYLSLTRAIGEDAAGTARLLSDITWLRLLLLAAAFTLGSLAVFTLPSLHGLWLAFWTAAAGFMAQSFSQLLMGVFQARAVVWRATVGDLAGRLTQLAVIIILSLSFFAGQPSVTAMAAAASLGALVSYAFHRSLLPVAWRLDSAPAWRQVKKIMRDTLPLGLLLILNVIYFRIDTVILSALRPVAEVGLYGLAYRMIESALFIPAMFGGLLLPHLSRPKADQRSLLNESFRAMLWAGTGFSLMLAFLAKPLIVFISGPQYVSAAPLLQILSIALAIMFVGNLFGFALVALHQQRPLLKLYLVLTAGNVLLNLWLIPRFGAYGAAWITVATEAAAALTAGILVRRLIPFSLNPLSLRGFQMLIRKP